MAPIGDDARVDGLVDLLRDGNVVVLTGAGISTESGIPDYRGATGAALRRHAPMTHQSFVSDPVARRRYWARSHMGWRIMRTAEPNAGHRAVAVLEHQGLVTGVITQNVDGLHQAAGSWNVVDLHGRLDRVICLSCGGTCTRQEVDEHLSETNDEWRTTVLAQNPDGDVDIPDADLDRFTVVDCRQCGGPLKPDVVYFGDSVPPHLVSACYDRISSASALLVLGTSLHVFSGRRFVVRAADRGIPVAIVNQGPTRGDHLATLRVDAPIGQTLMRVLDVAGWQEAPLAR